MKIQMNGRKQERLSFWWEGRLFMLIIDSMHATNEICPYFIHCFHYFHYLFLVLSLSPF